MEIAVGVGVGIAASVACSRASTVASMFGVGARVGVGAAIGPHAATAIVIKATNPKAVRMTAKIIAFKAGNPPFLATQETYPRTGHQEGSWRPAPFSARTRR